jgi:hypothetical protein
VGDREEGLGYGMEFGVIYFKLGSKSAISFYN